MIANVSPLAAELKARAEAGRGWGGAAEQSEELAAGWKGEAQHTVGGDWGGGARGAGFVEGGAAGEGPGAVFDLGRSAQSRGLTVVSKRNTPFLNCGPGC